MTDLDQARRREAIQKLQQAEMKRVVCTLEDGIRWERLGLGRLFFSDGVATFCPSLEVAR